MQPDVSVIIPFLNEEDNINELVSALNKYFSAKNNLYVEIVLVDDGSVDNSVHKLTQQTFLGYSVKLIKLSKNFGSHAAVRAGTLNANGRYVVFLPADLQDPLTLIDDCYDLITKKSADVVFAFRKDTKNRTLEKLFSSFYSFLMKKFVNPKFPDIGFDVVFFGEKIKKELNKNIESNSSIQLQILDFGYKTANLYYSKSARNIGKSKWTISKKIKLLIDSFVAFSYAPIRFVSLIGILFFTFGFLWTIYIIARKIIYNDLASGWPALTSILLLGFGVTNIGLGIISEYLWRTLDASRKRPVFIVDEIVELNKQDAS